MTVSIISHERVAAQLAKDATKFPDLATKHSVVRRKPSIDLRISHHDWRFMCSPGAIRRIIMNLVDNSFKYTETGIIRVHLDLQPSEKFPEFAKSQRSGTQILLLRVADTGIGMSAAFMKKGLFVPFSQVSSVSPGSGLGFSLMHAIVESLEGTVEVQSVLGEGTEVTIKIPLPSRPPNTSQPLFRNISHLQLQYPEAEKTFYIFGSGTSVQAAQNSLRLYMHEWFGFHEVAPESNPGITFVGADDAKPQQWPAELKASTPSTRGGVIVIHQATPTKTDEGSLADNFAVQHLVMPTGPRKLAKALRGLSEKIAALRAVGPGTEALGGSKNAKQASANPRTATTKFHSSSGISGNKAQDTLSSRPILVAKKASKDNSQTTAEGHTLAVRPVPAPQRPFSDFISSRNDIELPAQPHGASAAPDTGDDMGPWILCVDDNNINLTLLLTYSKKVNLKHVTGVEDGLQAFHAFQSCKMGYDLIFMGKSSVPFSCCDAASQRRIDGSNPANSC